MIQNEHSIHEWQKCYKLSIYLPNEFVNFACIPQKTTQYYGLK